MLAIYMPRMRNNILSPAILNIALATRASITDIRPLSSCPKLLFQCEAKFEATDKEMIFCSHSIKTRFHKRRFCSSLVLKVGVLELGNGLICMKWPPTLYNRDSKGSILNMII